MGFGENELLLFSILGGDKIGFGGSSRPVGAPKENLPLLAQSLTKNKKTSKTRRRFWQANSSAPPRRLLRRVFMASNHKADSDQTAGLFASFVTFLSNKEKFNSFLLYQKDFDKLLSARKEKVIKKDLPV